MVNSFKNILFIISIAVTRNVFHFSSFVRFLNWWYRTIRGSTFFFIFQSTWLIEMSTDFVQNAFGIFWVLVGYRSHIVGRLSQYQTFPRVMAKFIANVAWDTVISFLQSWLWFWRLSLFCCLLRICKNCCRVPCGCVAGCVQRFTCNQRVPNTVKRC